MEVCAKVRPTVLVATTSRWFSTARLAMALANAGFTVEVVCPPNHPLAKTSAVHKTHGYRGLAPVASFAAAISKTKPDFIVPCDDLATRHLHRLYDRERRRGKVRGLTCRAIERSLGSPESFPVLYARTAFMVSAQQAGIRVPKTAVIANVDDLRKWIARTGLPTVLKVDATSGGDGVRIVHTIEEAERAFRALQALPLLVRAAKRALSERDTTLVWSALSHGRTVINAQEFVAGHEATSAIACSQGTVLAALHFEVLTKWNSAGPATVVRLIENEEMSAAAERIARRLNLSGLHGFDFMLEAQTGDAYLTEINPRATQVGHLTLGPGRDLPAALSAVVSGKVVEESEKVTEYRTITLFPQEWLRNPTSAFLWSGYHDIPWEEPELVRACIRARWKQSVRYPQQEQAWIHALSAERVSPP